MILIFCNSIYIHNYPAVILQYYNNNNNNNNNKKKNYYNATMQYYNIASMFGTKIHLILTCHVCICLDVLLNVWLKGFLQSKSSFLSHLLFLENLVSPGLASHSLTFVVTQYIIIVLKTWTVIFQILQT